MMSTNSFSQSVTVKKSYLDKTIEELRTKDLWGERIKKQEKFIDSLKAETLAVRAEKKLLGDYYNSCTTEKADWAKSAANYEKLWKTERARKRKKGWTNLILTSALGGMVYLYINK